MKKRFLTLMAFAATSLFAFAQDYTQYVDPFIGNISFFKVNSGTIKKETEVFNPKKNKTERKNLNFLQG